MGFGVAVAVATTAEAMELIARGVVFASSAGVGEGVVGVVDLLESLRAASALG